MGAQASALTPEVGVSTHLRFQLDLSYPVLINLTNLAGTVALANGVRMPYLGLGVYKTSAGQPIVDAVTYALDAGYRHIDTAAAYANEAGVGLAV